jgi:hypothetical protein
MAGIPVALASLQNEAMLVSNYFSYSCGDRTDILFDGRFRRAAPRRRGIIPQETNRRLALPLRKAQNLLLTRG